MELLDAADEEVQILKKIFDEDYDRFIEQKIINCDSQIHLTDDGNSQITDKTPAEPVDNQSIQIFLLIKCKSYFILIFIIYYKLLLILDKK